MPTIHDVARAAGVSARTVSRVVNENGRVKYETRESVLAICEQLGFRPDPSARALKTGRKRMIGVVANAVSSDTTLRRIELLSKLFNAVGYALLIQYADNAEIEEAAIREIAPRCDALIVFTNLRTSEAPAFEALTRQGYPFILVDPPRAVAYPAIHIDRRSGYRDAVRYLYGRGRRKPVLLVEDFRSSERISGFKEGLEIVGLAFSETMVLHTGKRFAGGVQASGELISRIKAGCVDAVLCHNDKIALGLMNGLCAARIAIPDTVAVIGFDDDEYGAYLSPALTTIAQTGGDPAAYIFNQLRNRLEFGAAVDGTIFGTALVLRASA